MLQKLLRFSLLVFGCCFVTVSFADPITDIYQVEVVIFEHTDPKRFASEHWPKFIEKINTAKAVNLNNLKSNIPDSIDTIEVLDALDEVGDKPLDTVIGESITLVDSKHMLLKSEANKIKTSKAQRFIQQIAWNQPLATNVRSTPVYFTGGIDAEIASLIVIKPARNVFNVSIDMVYKLQPSEKHLAPGVNEIRLTRDIKVKKKEVFYVDHPVIGMFITLSPVILEN
jgi:hypothetical protein